MVAACRGMPAAMVPLANFQISGKMSFLKEELQVGVGVRSSDTKSDVSLTRVLGILFGPAAFPIFEVF